MPCERDMKYVDQLPNGYVFLEPGQYAPGKIIMAHPREPFIWEWYDDAMGGRYDPKCHKVMAVFAERTSRTEW